jgi:N-glycosylase/DNA lyase
LDRQSWLLTRILDCGNGAPVPVEISEIPGAIRVAVPRKPGKRTGEAIIRDVRHMLRLDDNMAGFYDLMTGDPDFQWIPKAGAGRLLRAPTVYEDLVKMMCTTNCSWSLTEKMVAGLVDALGARSLDGRGAFPTAAAMAQEPESFYRDVVRAGYRAPYLKELADRVASGEIDVESWLNSPLSTGELKREMKGVKGVGDYAAENILKLVGRYDGLGLDSWIRAEFARKHNRGRAAPDKKIHRHYSRFGEWRGLAAWCDMTHDWIDENGKAKW